ncbi:FtsH protease activity modulator HflK [Gallaecimonas sp. GXIMD4217]|uniref:FtsH protease activity modulator HflK n=1 Tax=Gallaecimonas sp. GXIMD4217 TaxID=3131927 RepID=UPI00311AD487
MAWNEPGNKDKDPWGNNRRDEQGPPDFDELMRKLGSRMGGSFGGKGGNFSSLGLALVLALAALVWAISGVYTIKEAEQGVVLRFGKYQDTVGPGLHWKATFIEKVYPVDVNSVRSLPASGFMLTKDENVVQVKMDVQYRILDPRAYLFNVTNADDSLSQATDAALRYVVGHTPMDDVLTSGREQVRRDTWDMIEKTIEPYGLGIAIEDVNFQDARPPEQVKNAFDDAIAAKEDEQRFIREAEAYASEIEPIARGKVQRMVQEAQAYKARVVLEAQGEVVRFNKLLPEFLAAPQVTRERLYLETMESVLGNSSKVLVDSDAGNMMYLPLDKILEQQKGQRPESEDALQRIQSKGREVQLQNSGTGTSYDSGRDAGRSSDRYGSGRN